MRKTRKRFTPSRTRRDVGRQSTLAIRSIEGVGHYKNSTQGRAAKSQAIATQWQLQRGMCPLCHTRIALSDAKFSLRQFTPDTENPVIHKRCCTPVVEEN